MSNTRVTALACAAIITMPGCAALKPVGVPIEFEHISHATQHIGANRTNYGVNVASVGLHWKPAPRLNVVLMEGFALNKEYTYADGEHSCGALWGGREVFTARVSYEVAIP